MKTNTFITLSTATANIGVLVGLVFLIFELRQNSKIALSQIRQERTLSVIDQYSAYAQKEEFTDLLTRAFGDGDFDSITKKEWGQIRYYELARAARLEDVFFQYSQGLIDETLYRLSLNMAASRLSIWKWLKVSNPNPDFSAAIADYRNSEAFKETNFAVSFTKWSKDKESPNNRIGSPAVFK